MTEFKSLQEQLIELQTRVSYQDDTLAQLNDVITEQDRIIQVLQKQMVALAKKHEEMNYTSEQGNSSNPADERPPHY